MARRPAIDLTLALLATPVCFFFGYPSETAGANEPASAPTSAPSGSDVLPPADQETLRRAQQALRAGDVRLAQETAKALFTAYPNLYAVQDLRCQLAVLQWLPREKQNEECADLKRLSASLDAGADSAPVDAGPPPSGEPASPPPPAAPPQEPPGATSPASGPSDASEEPRETSAPQQAPERIDIQRADTARYYAGFHWSVDPGVVFGNGHVGLSLAGRLEYGFDTGSVIVIPGLRVAAFFTSPNAYVGMPMMRLALPMGVFVPFVEGGAGVGEASDQTSLALLGGGGFMIHPSASFAFGLEASYETILGTGFDALVFGPVIAF